MKHHQVLQMRNMVKCQKWKTSSSVTDEKHRRVTRETSASSVTDVKHHQVSHMRNIVKYHKWKASSGVTDEKHRRVIDEKYRQVSQMENFVKCHGRKTSSIIIIIDNFCIALFSGVPKLTALYNILQHFLSFTNITHIIMTTNNV